MFDAPPTALNHGDVRNLREAWWKEAWGGISLDHSRRNQRDMLLRFECGLSPPKLMLRLGPCINFLIAMTKCLI
jgi:hypothetical protein